jgi:hypothetical protein
MEIRDYETCHYADFCNLLLLPLFLVQMFSSALFSQTPSICILPVGLEHKIHTIYATVRKTLRWNGYREIQLQLYKYVVVLTLLYGSECWNLTKEQKKNRIHAEEMLLLRAVVEYRLLDHKCNIGMRSGLKVKDMNK